MTVKTELVKHQAYLSALAPPMKDKEGFVRRVLALANGIWEENSYLQKCQPASFLRAVARAVQVGLEPNSPSQQCYIVPRDGKACLEIHGRGWARMAIERGLVTRMRWDIVHEGDRFEFEYGLEPKLVHKPEPRGDQAPVKAVYAVATLNNGEQDFFVLERPDLDVMVERSNKVQKGKNKSWADNFEGMAGAKVMKWYFKRREQGLDPLIQRAIEADDQSDLGESPVDPELPDAFKDAEVEVKDPEPTIQDLTEKLAEPVPPDADEPSEHRQWLEG